jgi:hypothetical protein
MFNTAHISIKGTLRNAMRTIVENRLQLFMLLFSHNRRRLMNTRRRSMFPSKFKNFKFSFKRT